MLFLSFARRSLSIFGARDVVLRNAVIDVVNDSVLGQNLHVGLFLNNHADIGAQIRKRCCDDAAFESKADALFDDLEFMHSEKSRQIDW